MITNEVEYGEARRRLGILETALDELRSQLVLENPAMFAPASAGYIAAIQELHTDVEDYLQSRNLAAPFIVRMVGKGAEAGRTSAKTLADLLRALQNAVGNEAKLLPEFFERPHFARREAQLHVLATASGSFVLGLEVGGGGERNLFEEVTAAERALLSVFEKVKRVSAKRVTTGDADAFREIHGLTELLNKDSIREIEFAYRRPGLEDTASLDLEAKRTLDRVFLPTDDDGRRVRGVIVSLNIEKNVCKVRPAGQGLVECRYRESLEGEIKAAIGLTVEIGGEFREGALGKVTILRIDSLAVIQEDVGADRSG